MTAHRTNKVLAFFGSDLETGKASSFLQRSVDNGTLLLTLDSAAMALATRAGAEYTVIDDWVAPERILHAITVAQTCRANWFDAARGEFTHDGICWPELDQLSMHWFWNEAMLAMELARAFREKGCTRVQFFKNLFPRAAVYFTRSDCYSKMLEAEIPGEADPIVRKSAFSGANLSALVTKGFRRIGRRFRSREIGGTNGVDRIPQKPLALVLGYEEGLRFTQVVSQLVDRFPDRVAAVIAGPYVPQYGDSFTRWKVPVLPGPEWPANTLFPSLPTRLLPTVDAEVSGKFREGFLKAREASFGKPWQRPMETLEFHFNYYLKYRWPVLCLHNYGAWTKIWEDLDPEAVLLSSRADPVFHLAGTAARKLGIPTVTVPHAVAAGRHLVNCYLTDYILYNSNLQKRYYLNSAFPERKLMGCRGLKAKHEYPVHPLKIFASRDLVRILVLTDPVEEGETLHKHISQRSQLQCLRSVANPPVDLVPKIEVAIKVNPAYPDTGMIEAAGPEVVRRAVAPTTELDSALDETDLVIAANYAGGALVHCLEARKPVIRFVTEPDASLQRPDYNKACFDEGTEVVRTPEALWNTVRKFVSDPDFASDLRNRADRFVHDSLDENGYATIGDLVERLRAHDTASGHQN